MNLFDLYVAISADNTGLKNSLNESEGLAQSAGEKIQSVLGKVISLEAIEKAGEALVSLTKAAVENYGEYEQLVGGMETLFKESSSKMVEYANQAYKTAQISANDYMDTVTSFSASLISSLGGDTEKASEYANNAIIDMSDNANKMGTTMELIQNAYQGFAKQNYTMLDNLKLGYGGTKEEMERLLEDAQKLSGIKYDISSFADITSAIHVIQEEMGITGTSAKEATTTIQGSFNMLQSAWTNLSTAMADPSQSIGTALNQVITSAQAFGTNLVPVINSAVPALVDGLTALASTAMTELPAMISGLIPTILSSVENLILNVVDMLPQGFQTILDVIPTLLTTVIDTIVQGAPKLIESLTEMVPMLTETITTMCNDLAADLPANMPIFIENLLTLIQGLATTLAENAPIMLEAGLNLIMALAQGLINSLPTLIEQVPTIITTIANIINNNAPTILASGVQLIIMLVKGIISAIPTLIANIPQIIEAIVSVWSAFNWINLGKNAINALKDGILALRGAVSTAGKNILTAITNAISNLPQTLLSIGRNGITGIINGISAMRGNLLNIVGNLMMLVVKAFGSFSLVSIGRNLIAGLFSGIASMAGTLISYVYNLGKTIISTIAGVFKIKSPSRVMKQIGEYVVDGFMNGLDTLDPDEAASGFNDVIGSIGSLSSTATRNNSASIYDLLAEYLPGVANQSIVLDTGALVGQTVGAYDTALGRRYVQQKRYV